MVTEAQSAADHPRARARHWLAVGVLVLVAQLGGCAVVQNVPEVSFLFDARNTNLAAKIDAAATRLVAANPSLPTFSPLIASTFVNVNNLKESSTFGRMSAELFASALSQAGVKVREVKMRESLFVEQGLGELILSRDIQRLRADYAANAILLGTYAQGVRQVYLSVRVVSTRDAMVIAATDLSLPLDNNIRSMLTGQSWYEF